MKIIDLLDDRSILLMVEWQTKRQHLTKWWN